METNRGFFPNYPTTQGDDIDMNIYNAGSIQNQARINSIIAIGNPIVDISAEIDKDSIQKYRLRWGETIFADKSNVGFFDELENKPRVTYIPGGSIQNSLRVCSWCLNMEPKNQGKFKISMLGAVGDDKYKGKILNALTDAGVKPLLQSIPNMNTSRCGVGIYKKERCLLPEIRASNCLTEEFVNEHRNEIFDNDALLIEGYFLQEKFEICKYLCNEFRKEDKLVILTLSATFMVQFHYEKIFEIAQNADMIISNYDEIEVFAGTKGESQRVTFEKAHKKLPPRERLLVVTAGSNGVFLSKFNYKRGQLDFILQSFPVLLKPEEIVDLNGAGDAFFGGFLSQYMKGSSLYSCCRAGNDASHHILKNIGCTFQKDKVIEFIN